MEAWRSVVDYVHLEGFHYRVQTFENVYSPWHIFVEYINGTWLISYNETFVKAWMDKVMHLGNTTSNMYVGINHVFYLISLECEVHQYLFSFVGLRLKIGI